MDKKYIFSIDLGGTSSKVAILSKDGKIIEKWEIPTNKDEKGKYIIKEIYQSFLDKIHHLKLDKDEFLGVGMGAPGPVLKDGSISKAVNIGWENYPLQAELKATFSLPAFVENDANCAALGEMWQGAGKGLTDIVAVTLGTGVGGGVIVGGKIVSGISGGAGEIGHITVQLEHGFSCNCGKTGCLETVASATGVVNLAMQQLEKNEQDTILSSIYNKTGCLTSKDVFDAAKTGDKVANKIVEQVGFYLGYALSTLGAVVNPQAFIIGGGVSKAGQTLIEPIENYYNQFAFPPTRNSTKLLLAKLGNDAGIFGAGYLVKQNV
jgi:glucokinase